MEITGFKELKNLTLSLKSSLSTKHDKELLGTFNDMVLLEIEEALSKTEKALSKTEKACVEVARRNDKLSKENAELKADLAALRKSMLVV